MSERFYVREHTGYRGTAPGSSAKPQTEVMVIDGAYCHCVVRSFLTGRNKHGTALRQGAFASLDARRAQAAALCDELNRGETERLAA